MNTAEENFEADKIQAAIDYLEFKGELNKIKAQAIEEMMREIPTKSYVGINEIFHTRKSMFEYVAILRGK